MKPSEVRGAPARTAAFDRNSDGKWRSRSSARINCFRLSNLRRWAPTSSLIFSEASVTNGAFEDPSYRDIFTLHREARRGWLSKELDFHYSDECGYRHQVVRRGKDISKRQFDDLAKSKGSDVFLISDRDADLNPSITSKDIWYCCLDLNNYARRFGEDLSVAVRNLNGEAARFTVSYLQRKHGIDMSPLLTLE